MSPLSNRPPRLDIDPKLLAHVRSCIDDIRRGEMVILVDDEDRENEGDLVFAAETVTAEKVNFMAKHARGLICLTMTEEQVARLELPMMSLPQWRGGPPLGTAFTLSIEARDGVTTGISASDRARTIEVAIADNASPTDIVTPGHVFPLKSRDGGVLVRTGQTEGSVDLARLSGLSPAGVICEIMNDDGTMARMPDLEIFAREHGLKILTIADLVEYRMQTERLVKRTASQQLTLDCTGGTWEAMIFEVSTDGQEILALVFGEPASRGSLCRVHQGTTLGDVFASAPGRSGSALRRSAQQIEGEGAGVIVYIPTQGSLRAELESRNPDAVATSKVQGGGLREFGLGAQVLRELKLEAIRLLTNNPKKLVGIRGYGLEVLDTVPIAN